MGAFLAYGFVSNIDAEKGLVRVEFKEYATADAGKNLVSDWLQVSVPKSLNDKHTFPYDIGEHVWCMMEDENCENGIVGGALYNTVDLPDGAGEDIYRIKFKDGSFIELNRSTGNYTIDVKGDVNINAQSTGKKIIFNGGSNDGLVIVDNTKTQFNNVENDINDLKSILMTIVGGAPISEPGSGAPSAFQAALAAALSGGSYYSLLTLTTKPDIENPDVTH